MNSLLNFEIIMWRKLMQNKYFQLIGEIFLNNNIVIDIERRKNIIEQISRPYFRTILVGMITFFVKFATLMLIIQPEWINNYNYFEILSRMLPNDGRKYLSAALNMCAINTVVIAFYATSTNYEQFRFLLPIRYSQCRHLNKQDSDHYEWIKDYNFNDNTMRATFTRNDTDVIIRTSVANIYILDIILAINHEYLGITYSFGILSCYIIHIHLSILYKSTTKIIPKNNTKII
ncbi:hypothetical protein BLA29_003655 [Euroglyphus maynei]|uniref:Uncharacterized protein n=1 Tax=Euroglyphus maynei TaxID=6958 RepID=A0A1Y3APP1_EURMA|nr:hypothetical protein BLA29_003655 [Euroglyphus maynei]